MSLVSGMTFIYVFVEVVPMAPAMPSKQIRHCLKPMHYSEAQAQFWRYSPSAGIPNSLHFVLVPLSICSFQLTFFIEEFENAGSIHIQY